MEHDLDLLLTLATENDIELPPELVETGWLTPWATTYENAEPSPGTLDRRQAIEIAEAVASWLKSAIAVDTDGPKSEATGGSPPSHGAGTLADFEAEYGPVQPPDGEG